jgi:hypothetical protein
MYAFLPSPYAHADLDLCSFWADEGSTKLRLDFTRYVMVSIDNLVANHYFLDSREIWTLVRPP